MRSYVVFALVALSLGQASASPKTDIAALRQQVNQSATAIRDLQTQLTQARRERDAALHDKAALMEANRQLTASQAGLAATADGAIRRAEEAVANSVRNDAAEHNKLHETVADLRNQNNVLAQRMSARSHSDAKATQAQHAETTEAIRTITGTAEVAASKAAQTLVLADHNKERLEIDMALNQKISKAIAVLQTTMDRLSHMLVIISCVGVILLLNAFLMLRGKIGMALTADEKERSSLWHWRPKGSWQLRGQPPATSPPTIPPKP